MSQGCGTCRFSREGPCDLECHRHAPQPRSEWVPDGKAEIGQEVTIWPAVDDDDWCGEWQSKAAAEALQKLVEEGLRRQ